MSYVGLVPSESSSGESTSRGRITKTGNAHVRRLLVEAAWHHARPLSPASETDAASSAGLPAEAAGIASRANRRLHRRYLDLRARGKGANVTNVAVARELVGFCWALALCG
jgi:transposase